MVDLLHEIKSRYPDCPFEVLDAATFSGLTVRMTGQALRQLVKDGRLEFAGSRTRFRLLDGLPQASMPEPVSAPVSSSAAEQLAQFCERLDAYLVAEGLTPLEKLELLIKSGRRAMQDREKLDLSLEDQTGAITRLQDEKSGLNDLLKEARADNGRLLEQLQAARADAQRAGDLVVKLEVERDDARSALEDSQDLLETEKAAHARALALLERVTHGERLVTGAAGGVQLPSGKVVDAAPVMAVPVNAQTQQLGAQIQRYFQDNPGAVKTLAQLLMELGIAGDMACGTVRQALNALVGDGILVCSRDAGQGQNVYRLPGSPEPAPIPPLRAKHLNPPAQPERQPARVRAPKATPEGKSVAEKPKPAQPRPPQPEAGPAAAKPWPARKPEQVTAVRPVPAPKVKPAPEPRRRQTDEDEFAGPRDLPPLRDRQLESSDEMKAAILSVLQQEGRALSATLLRSKVVMRDKRTFDGSLAALVRDGQVQRDGNLHRLVTA